MTLRTYLLDADDDLAQQFEPRTRFAVRQGTTVRVVEAAVGECQLQSSLDAVRGGPGLMVLAGLIAHETRVGDRTTVELLGACDLLQPSALQDDALLDHDESWRALWPTRFGLLDLEFGDRIKPWPQIGQTLLRRACRRISDLDTMRAISSHPRLEVRLDLLMWHLAARWGRVELGGIRLTLPLTHRLLGELVAAERPSITHALARLADAGLVIGDHGDWHLVGLPQEHLDSLIEHTVRLTHRRT
jgi:CRP/FNR family transcriptional regulator, cyclic AMP receptor protein